MRSQFLFVITVSVQVFSVSLWMQSYISVHDDSISNLLVFRPFCPTTLMDERDCVCSARRLLFEGPDWSCQDAGSHRISWELRWMCHFDLRESVRIANNLGRVKACPTSPSDSIEKDSYASTRTYRRSQSSGNGTRHFSPVAISSRELDSSPCRYGLPQALQVRTSQCLDCWAWFSSV